MALIAGFGVAVVATPLAMWVATRIGFVNEPGRLKVHARPIPYLGGVAVLLALVGPVVTTRPSLLIPLALAALLGLADDATDVPPVLRIGAELVIGLGPRGSRRRTTSATPRSVSSWWWCSSTP